MDSHLRSVAKAVTWRAGGSVVTAVVARRLALVSCLRHVSPPF